MNNELEINNIVTHPTTTVKPAAIWARVSTTNQAETSLPSQLSRCQEKLKQEGFSAIHTFAVDWTSMDLFSCPDFQELRRLIANREIAALGVYDRDRLEAKGLQRLIFLSELKEAAITLVICQGPPIIEGPEGQIVELALAIGKERQVLRARQGSRDGLHDRAVKFGKPTTYHRLYGYQWDKTNNRLVPDDNHQNVRLIFELLLEGNGYKKIISELKSRGILSPSGNIEWNAAVLSAMVHNPAYAGRYYALKKVAVEPKKRKGNSYGNSSVKKLPLDESHYLPEIEIVDPPIAWTQRGLILDQLERHQKLSSRNADNDYLLRGMILCETHIGKQGEPRRYHGRPKGKTFYYACPVGGDCLHPYLKGPEIESKVKFRIRNALLSKAVDYHSKPQLLEDNAKQFKKELQLLERKYDKLIASEAKLEERYIGQEIDPEVYENLKAKYQVERQGNRKRQTEISEQLKQSAHRANIIEQLKTWLETWRTEVERQLKISKFVTGHVDLSQQEWRQLLETLNLKVHVRTKEENEKLKYGDMYGGQRNPPTRRLFDYDDIWFEIAIPVNFDIDIALNNPEPD